MDGLWDAQIALPFFDQFVEQLFAVLIWFLAGLGCLGIVVSLLLLSLSQGASPCGHQRTRGLAPKSGLSEPVSEVSPIPRNERHRKSA